MDTTTQRNKSRSGSGSASTVTKTALTNNSQASVNMTNGSALTDIIDTTTNLVLWETKVDTSYATQTLKSDQSSDTLVLKAGAQISYKPVSAGAYYVYFTGEIIDDGNTTTFKNKLIGNYVPSDV